VITGAGKLKAKYVIHAVGPRYRGNAEDAELLESAYRESMRLAAEAGCQSVAFPSISTGAYGYPLGEAAPIALRTVWEALEEPSSVKRARFVLFDEATLGVFEAASRQLHRARARSKAPR
jgi:O-acetyl-ADP-ribose deacetylase (regulator of RNase III)